MNISNEREVNTMRISEFNYYYKKLTSENGKQYFEEELQYIGWLFLILTEDQYKKITDLLIKWEYPIEHFGAYRYIRFPNGMKLLIHE